MLPSPRKEPKDHPLLSLGLGAAQLPAEGPSMCSSLSHPLTVTPQTAPPCHLILLPCGLCIPNEPFRPMEN